MSPLMEEIKNKQKTVGGDLGSKITKIGDLQLSYRQGNLPLKPRTAGMVLSSH